MSAELLRRAAAEIRRRAEAATPGPWTYDGNPSGAVWPDVPEEAGPHAGHTLMYVQPRNDLPVAYLIENGPAVPTETQKANAKHIASWHPAVAFAVADLLDKWAWMIGLDPELHHRVGGEQIEGVARVYLGGPDPAVIA